MSAHASPTRAEALRRARRSTMTGIVANGLLAMAKGVAGILGNSYALVADAIESTSDVVSSGIVYVGLRVAELPPNEKHPYGKGRAETLSAMAVSVALLLAALVIAIQSVHEIRNSHHAPAPFTLAVLVVVILVKETLFRFVFKVGSDVASAAVKTDAWHHRSDAITSVAAFIGISVALIGGPGYEAADDWAALFAAGIIAINGWNLLVPAMRELTDAIPDSSLAEAMRKTAEAVPGVCGIHRCWVRKLGFDHYVDIDVIVDGDLTVREGHDIAHLVRVALAEAFPLVARTMVHIEPDDPEEINKPLWPDRARQRVDGKAH